MLKKHLTSSVLSYLRFHARKALIKHDPTIIGIAGSVGKSSARNAIEAVLKDHFPTKSVGNSETGIPLGILGMRPTDYSLTNWATMLLGAPLKTNYLQNTKYLIAEMGIDEPSPPKNMEYLLTILKPHIAVILNESATHTMQFEKALTKSQLEELSGKKRVDFLIKKIAEEDAKIITKSSCTIGIYNADDSNITNALSRHSGERSDSRISSADEEQGGSGQVPTNRDPDIVGAGMTRTLLTFGKSKQNHVSYDAYKITLDGSSFSFSVNIPNNPNKLITLTFPNLLLPEAYQQTFAAAILIALQTGLTLEQIQTSLEKNFTLPKGRSNIFKGIQDTIIIDSSYNASKAAVFAFLNMVALLKKQTKRPVVFVFGDMRELGEESKIEHEEVAEKLIGIVDYLYCVGPQTRQFVFPIVQKHEEHFREIRWFDTSVRAGAFLKENMPKNAIVLVKGSQNTIFLEETVKAILQNSEDEQYLCRQDQYWKKIKMI
ncbi:MAG: hypothetical protein HY430_00220 [Candidatus Levybacteria bacterium]|nr:hypothetical protein [Candidatus Levybacteria bacterium]